MSHVTYLNWCKLHFLLPREHLHPGARCSLGIPYAGKLAEACFGQCSVGQLWVLPSTKMLLWPKHFCRPYTPLHENSIPWLINVFDFCHFFNCIHHYLSKWWHIIEQVNLYSPLLNIGYIPSDISCYQYFFVCIVRSGSLFGYRKTTHFICFPPYITLTNNTQSNIFLFSFGLVVLWFFPPFYRFHQHSKFIKQSVKETVEVSSFSLLLLSVSPVDAYFSFIYGNIFKITHWKFLTYKQHDRAVRRKAGEQHKILRKRFLSVVETCMLEVVV